MLFKSSVCSFNYCMTVSYTTHQYLPMGDKILYLLSCHSSAQATLIIPWQLLTHFKASVALNSIPKPWSCCILRTLSPNIISGREGMCNSSANLQRKNKRHQSATAQWKQSLFWNKDSLDHDNLEDTSSICSARLHCFPRFTHFTWNAESLIQSDFSTTKVFLKHSFSIRLIEKFHIWGIKKILEKHVEAISNLC